MGYSMGYGWSGYGWSKYEKKKASAFGRTFLAGLFWPHTHAPHGTGYCNNISELIIIR
jgi:hypothetical protein